MVAVAAGQTGGARGSRFQSSDDAGRCFFALCARSQGHDVLAAGRSAARCIRRVSFDLIGLPPTPEEVDAFVADTVARRLRKSSSTACSPSPHYGERWARHWMDVVHFAETHGHDQDRAAAERLAVSRLPDPRVQRRQALRPLRAGADRRRRAVPRRPAGDRRALGFLAAGPWDESSLRDIREDTIDRKIAQLPRPRRHGHDGDVDVLQQLTVHCARCHDHKFDPIPQDDYYGLQAVFAGVDRAERALRRRPGGRQAARTRPSASGRSTRSTSGSWPTTAAACRRAASGLEKAFGGNSQRAGKRCRRRARGLDRAVRPARCSPTARCSSAARGPSATRTR